VIEYLTYEVFRYTCRGLYENHKFLLVLFLTLKKDIQTGYVRHMEFGVFIKGLRFLLPLSADESGQVVHTSVIVVKRCNLVLTCGR